jgi:hypothetical protein
VHVTPGVLLLGVIHERVHIALERERRFSSICQTLTLLQTPTN